MGEKLRAVFLPLLLLMLAFAAGVSLVNWLMLRAGWPRLDETVAAVWLPAALAIALVALVMKRRLRVLALNEKRNIPSLYGLVAFVCVAGPAILAQEYVQAASGSMAHVASVAEIAAHPEARFFSVAAPCLKKSNALPHSRFSVSGDHDESLDVDLYVAVPLCGTRSAFLGITYHDSLDNKLPDDRKDAAYRDFLKRSQAAFDSEDPSHYRYLERLGFNADRRGFLKALKDHHIEADQPVILLPHTEAFAPRGGSLLGGTVLALAGAAGLWLFMVLFAPLRPVPERTAPPPGVFVALVTPTRESFGLPLLLDINLLVFAAMVLSGLGFLDFEIDDLVAWGASSGSLDHGLGLVRLITATFVHAGLFHILGNMYALLFAAMYLTPVARNARLIVSYLACGLGGSIVSVSVHPDVVCVGASGAIFGLFGALLALIVLRDAKMVPLTRAVLLNIAIFVVFNLIYGAATPGIDNAAHIGGFLTGLLCGGVIYVLDRLEQRRAGPAQGGP